MPRLTVFKNRHSLSFRVRERIVCCLDEGFRLRKTEVTFQSRYYSHCHIEHSRNISEPQATDSERFLCALALLA